MSAISPLTSLRECPICMDDYDNNDHIPNIAADCAHTFCKSCLNSVANCPQCRTPIDKSKLKPNYAFIDALQANARLASEGAASVAKAQKTMNVQTDQINQLKMQLAASQHKIQQLQTAPVENKELRALTKNLQMELAASQRRIHALEASVRAARPDPRPLDEPSDQEFLIGKRTRYGGSESPDLTNRYKSGYDSDEWTGIYDYEQEK